MELLDVAWRHAVEPVEPIGVARGRPDHRRASLDSIFQQVGASKSMGTAPRTTPHCEAIPTMQVGHHCNIARHIGDAPTRPAR
jgi:hypothetical protein